MTDCGTCKRYADSVKGGEPLDCFNAEYYLPRMIWFCRPQMIWLIEHLGTLIAGSWPTNPQGQGSGYTETISVQHTRSSRAGYETPCEIAAEVEWRLKRTGIEGKLLVAEVRAGYYFDEYSQESRRALNFISGWRRRWTPYRQWLAVRRQRVK